MKRYTHQHRLSDVIALISVLATDEYTFRSVEKLETALRSKPKSVAEWAAIAEDHPEFFRFNGKRTSIALLIRSYFVEDENKQREPLKVAETQKLIDVAITLHDKELARGQRFGYWFPLIVAFISLAGLVGTTIYNTQQAKIPKQQYDTLVMKLEQIENKIGQRKP